MSTRTLTLASGQWLVLALALALALAAPVAAAGPPKPFEGRGWLNGPDGLVKGITAAETEDKPLVVYFYTDWCGYCRQFEQTILDTPKFRTFVEGAAAVRINPDKSDKARSLAAHYGVRGYPTFFVWGTTSKKLIRTERYDIVDGQPQILSPERFIARIEETSRR